MERSQINKEDTWDLTKIFKSDAEYDKNYQEVLDKIKVIKDMKGHILDDENLYKQVLDETILHAWATVEEIAKWSYFVTVINKSMTGQDILIDNGEASKANFIW